MDFHKLHKPTMRRISTSKPCSGLGARFLHCILLLRLGILSGAQVSDTPVYLVSSEFKHRKKLLFALFLKCYDQEGVQWWSCREILVVSHKYSS